MERKGLLWWRYRSYGAWKSHRIPLLKRHFGADASVGKNFQEEGVGEAAVHEVDFADSGMESVDGGADFRDHAAGDRAVCDEGVCLFDIDGFDQ